MEIIKTQAVVIGGGSGGFGAAWSLAKNGINTVLIEKNSGLGGTSVFGGVNCYEPGVCEGELHRILKDRLLKIPDGAAVSKEIPGSMLLSDENPSEDFEKYPWVLSVPTAEASYDDTLKRCLSLTKYVGAGFRRFQFEPSAMDKTMQDLLAEHKEYISIMFNASFFDCETKGDKITAVWVETKDNIYKIQADYFVDATGDILLARSAGCDVAIGTDDKSMYNEPSASVADDKDINGVTYMFRVKKSEDTEHIDNLPVREEVAVCDTVSWFNVYPNGDINVNMLPTFTGKEWLKYGNDADKVGRNKVFAYWNWLQRERGMKGYEFLYIFPMAGVRETYRLRGRYVLTEQDIRAGIENQNLKDELIAIADHALDVHGKGEHCREVEKPYGIPFSCTRPKEYENMFVACRGASFSHIAASSARLSRTMLSLGEAVGEKISEMIKISK